MAEVSNELPEPDPQPVDTAWLVSLGKITSREGRLSDDALVELAYDEAKEQIVKRLEGDLRFRDGVVEKSDGVYGAMWAEMRRRGVPDRRAERDAFLKLLEQVRRLEFPSGWGDAELERQESGRATDHHRTP